MQFGSYIASFLLHISLLIGILLFPSSPPIKLDRVVYQVSLVDGAPGGNLLPSAVLGPEGAQSAVKKEVKPIPESLPPKAEAIAPPPAEAKPVEQKNVAPEPKPKPESVPRPESVPTPAKIPEPPKDAVALSEKKVEKKPEPEQPKPDPKTPPKSADKPAPKTKGDEKKISPNDALKAALADAQKQATSQNYSRQSAVAGALADLQKQSSRQGQGGGGGGEGDGPGGGGINDVYAGLVIMAVRPNWSMPTYSRDNLAAVVRIKLDPQGNVLDCRLEKSSGRADFDASTVNAVIRTKTLPIPPTREQQELILTFNSQEMMGR